MAHYAFLTLEANGLYKVVEVIPGRDETEVVDGISDWEQYYGELRGMKCLRTSYNGNIRKNFACIDGWYDQTLDAFIPPRPDETWEFDEETCRWKDPSII